MKTTVNLKELLEIMKEEGFEITPEIVEIAKASIAIVEDAFAEKE